MFDEDGGAFIEWQRGIGRRLEKFVEAGRGRNRVVMQGGEAAFAVGADAQLLPGVAAMPDRAIHLCPGEHEFYRPAEHARSQYGQDLRTVEDRLRAEAATQER